MTKLEAKNIVKYFSHDSHNLKALGGVNLKVESGDFVFADSDAVVFIPSKILDKLRPKVIDAAEEETRRLKNETEDFLDQRLGSFEILLDRLSKTVANGRNRLSIGSEPPPPESEEPIEQQEVADFFNQDDL